MIRVSIRRTLENTATILPFTARHGSGPRLNHEGFGGMTPSSILKVILCFQAPEHGRPSPVLEVPAGFSVLPGSEAFAKTGGIPKVPYLVWSPCF